MLGDIKPLKIVLVGCGKMGSALLDSWFKNLPKTEFLVIDPSPLPEKYTDQPSIKHITSAKDEHRFIQSADVILLAIKPQHMDAACAPLHEVGLNPETVILSIAAGQAIDKLENIFGHEQPIIRTMPNTPAAIGKGMIVAVANKAAQNEHKTIANTLLSGCGLLEWIEDENLMDAVTAISGSGPAYVFYLVEILSKAGEENGLPATLAMTLARQTVIGSAALTERNISISASTLRKNVTSPGGTTEAALNVLMDGKWEDILNKAVKEAIKRSEKLNS